MNLLYNMHWLCKLCLMIQKPNLILVDSSLIINRSIGDVFRFVSNHENYPKWYPDVDSVRSANNLPHRTVGKKYAEILRMPTGRNRTIDIEVIDVVPPNSFVTIGNFPPLHPKMTFMLSVDSDTSTKVRWMFESRNQSHFGRFIVKRLLRPIMLKQAARASKNLKDLLEAV